ncbi:hypothetical protein IV55_GL000800 [Furfurilactobacillus siliginis]|uniref:Uncharacterized protein n=1 Tax=Furfurilactobacillus siliginis TaxID=348151 RepID=A0A0R2L5D4_9LACO|nr:hypothetical protein IV55_GL000800 [Furfurilactobacillus siliginis]
MKYPYERKQLYEILSDSEHFGQDYEKFKGSDYDDFIFDKINQAVTNAKKLRYQYSQKDFLDEDPYTNIEAALPEIFNTNKF